MLIIKNGNKVLRKVAEKITAEEISSQKIKNIINRMIKTMSESKDGVALAAPQINESVRIFIVDGNIWKNSNRSPSSVPVQPKTDFGSKPVVFINPVIKKSSKRKLLLEEGCLSITGISGTIKRSEKLTIEALDGNGKKFSRGVSGLLAQIIQHEMDHLNGVLFIDKAIHLKKVESSK
ncbi:peptide deformylase [Patescibacteria group bacterium]|nr:peptide deformylase [Patescibacteria group bacterium]